MYSEGLGISRRLFHNETPPHSVADSHKTMPSAAPVLTYARQPTSASMRLPAGACDSHVHVFGPPERFPYSPQSVLRPATASKETLFALHRHLGIERCVIVQSMVHGMDNRVIEDAIAAGQGRYLGVALVPSDVSDAALDRLVARGFKGVRFNFMPHLGPAIDRSDLRLLSHRLADRDMHLQIHMASALIQELSPWLQEAATPVVVDHMGRVDARQGLQSAEFQALCRLLDHSGLHVKVSGIDRVDAGVDASGHPHQPFYSAGIALAHYLVKTFPEQCVWGTDWPHPHHTHVPDDGVLTDALAQIAPSEQALQALLVDNPLRLYKFDHVPSSIEPTEDAPA
jgi:2-pyrone-4,6-dicarboxylate lactonase